MTQDESPAHEPSKALVIKPNEGNIRALTTRFGDEFTKGLTPIQFLGLCNIYGLNPWMGHMVPFQGRPYIQEQGWLFLIQRECPGQLSSIESRPATEKEYEQFGVPEEDYFAHAAVTRRYELGHEPVMFQRRAKITKRQAQASEKEAMAQERGKKGRHVVEDPWDMVEKQARVRVLRMAFPDVLARASGQPEPSTPTQAEAIEAPPVPGAPVADEDGVVIETPAIEVKGGEKAAWDRLWAVARDRGLGRDAVHEMFGAGIEDKALKAVAEKRAVLYKVSLEQAVQDMADILENAAVSPAVEAEPAEEPEEAPAEAEPSQPELTP